MHVSEPCSFHKTGFLAVNCVGTLLLVGAVGIAAVVAAAAALALLLRRALLRRRGVPPAVVRLAQGIPDALGDAALAIDAEGRVVFANSAAGRLAGASVAELIDRDVAEIAPDLAALSRGLERGPAAARLVLSGPAGPVRVQAALVRILARPPMAFAVLRQLPRPLPPPLPLQHPSPSHADRARARAGLAAAAAAVRDPIAEAADALSLLRLGVARLAPHADAALGAAEAAVAAAARRIAEIEAAGQPCAPRRRLDLAALVQELVAASPAPPGVRILFDGIEAPVVADERPVRAAVRELLAAVVASLPEGGDIAVAVHGGRGVAAVEIQTPASLAPGGLALARALVAPQGGRVEEEPALERGWAVRVVLEGAPALEPA